MVLGFGTKRMSKRAPAGDRSASEMDNLATVASGTTSDLEFK